jgi:hypothetical protein
MSFRKSQRWIVCAAMGLVVVGLPGQPVFSADTAADGPVAAPVPAKLYRLRYKFRPNELVYYDVQHRSKRTIKSVGLVDVTTTEIWARKHFRVISVDREGAGLLELIIDHVKMRVDFGKNAPLVEFDSRSKDKTPRQFQRVKASIGMPRVRMRLAANGELIQVTLLNRASQPARGQLKYAPQTDANDPSHNFLVVFPQESIAVGHSWSDRMTVDVRTGKTLVRPITLLRKHSLTSVKGNLATISISTRILSPIRDPKIRTQLIQRTPKVTVVFDLDRGVIVEKTMTINKRQIGGITENSSMHVVSKRTERLVIPTQETASRGNK